MFCGKCGKPMSEREEILSDGCLHVIGSCFECNIQKDIGIVVEDGLIPAENESNYSMPHTHEFVESPSYIRPGKVSQEVIIKKGVNWGEVMAVVISLIVIFLVAIYSSNRKADSNETAVVHNNSSESHTTNKETATKSLEESIEVVNEYTYENSYATEHIFVIKNTSNKTINVGSNSTAFDSNGEAIGADSATLDVLGAGCTSVMYEYHKGVSGVASYETTFTASEEKYYDSVIQDIQIEKITQPGKVIVTLTNTGTQDAEFVQAHAIFLKDGKVVSYKFEYVVDTDSCIKSGATLSEQIDCREDFDEVEVYVTGRR